MTRGVYSLRFLGFDPLRLKFPGKDFAGSFSKPYLLTLQSGGKVLWSAIISLQSGMLTLCEERMAG